MCWYWASNGVGSKVFFLNFFESSKAIKEIEFLLTLLLYSCFLLQDMVVLPYKDSLLLFSRYLQQLVMESLGKEFDLDGNTVSILFNFLCSTPNQSS